MGVCPTVFVGGKKARSTAPATGAGLARAWTMCYRLADPDAGVTRGRRAVGRVEEVKWLRADFPFREPRRAQYLLAPPSKRAKMPAPPIDMVVKGTAAPSGK
jgi:hypothetical protein